MIYPIQLKPLILTSLMADKKIIATTFFCKQQEQGYSFFLE